MVCTLRLLQVYVFFYKGYKFIRLVNVCIIGYTKRHIFCDLRIVIMKFRLIFIASLLFTSIMLAAGLAHVFSLPNKINLSRDEYLISQQLYRGWNLLAIAVVATLISLVIQTVISRKKKGIFFPTIGALICLLVSQAIFWIYTYPANRQTNNWSYLPDNWMELRKTWEYSHAVAFIFNLAGLILIILSVVNKKTTGHPAIV